MSKLTLVSEHYTPGAYADLDTQCSLRVVSAQLGSETIGYAECLEGFRLVSLPEQVEPGVCEIPLIWVERNYRGTGVGSKLTLKAIDEARDMRASYVRCMIANPTVVPLLHKLALEGEIEIPHIVRTSKREIQRFGMFCTAELLTRDGTDAETAFEYLSLLPRNRDGMVVDVSRYDRIECVIAL